MTQNRTHPHLSLAEARGLVRALATSGHAALAARSLTHPTPPTPPQTPAAPAPKRTRRHPHTSSSTFSAPPPLDDTTPRF